METQIQKNEESKPDVSDSAIVKERIIKVAYQVILALGSVASPAIPTPPRSRKEK